MYVYERNRNQDSLLSTTMIAFCLILSTFFLGEVVRACEPTWALRRKFWPIVHHASGIIYHCPDRFYYIFRLFPAFQPRATVSIRFGLASLEARGYTASRQTACSSRMLRGTRYGSRFELYPVHVSHRDYSRKDVIAQGIESQHGV